MNIEAYKLVIDDLDKQATEEEALAPLFNHNKILEADIIASAAKKRFAIDVLEEVIRKSIKVA